MLSILQNDDLDGLKAFVSSGYTEKDLLNEIHKDSPKILLHSPPLISVAAYYGSVKCTTYLIREGYDLFQPDLVPFSLIFNQIFFPFPNNSKNGFL